MAEKIKQLQQFLRWFWQIAKIYFVSAAWWRSWGLLTIVLLFTVVSRPLGLQSAIYGAKITTALSQKDFAAYKAALLISTGLLAGVILLALSQSVIEQKFKLYWRQWLTNNFLDRYFKNRVFYSINSDKAIDNPDQRISQDITAFIDQSLGYVLGLSGTLIGGFLYIGTLWNINNYLVFIAIGTAILQTLISYLLGRVLTPLNFKSLEYEADFRYSLVHVRNNSEAIAFYEGEAQERGEVGSRFSRLLSVLNAKILPNGALSAFKFALSILTNLICTLLLAPRYFNGEVELGDFQLSVAAFGHVVGVFNWFSSNFNSLTQFAAVLKRLGSLEDYFIKQEKPIAKQAPSAVIETIIEPRLVLSHLTVQTPDQKRTLVTNLSAEVPDSEGILVMGASGLGKSSILRAVAGLWHQGDGYIYRPATTEMLFIPQRPYMVLGSLRKQILYPHTQQKFTDARLQEVLAQVNLGNLIERVGGLDTVLDWADVLSLGEQQRLGFARLFLHSPRYAVLDESTSALDVANEKHLYQMLRDDDITYISVGHRPTLIPYHQFVLEILGEGKWRLFPSDNAGAAIAFS
ncbi:MAG: ABC transporter ATP-binding protein/permease [Snowella sp.]|nr:ABC transporter ATP-binding protein/permease [Snowella sp.]